MDDIDRTYWKLKRLNVDDLASIMHRQSGWYDFFSYKPGSNEPMLDERFTEICIQNGWTPEEFTEAYNTDGD